MGVPAPVGRFTQVLTGRPQGFAPTFNSFETHPYNKSGRALAA